MDNREEILARLSACSIEDFDGHTDFHRLSARHKLIWLSSTVRFMHRAACNNPALGCNVFFSGKVAKPDERKDGRGGTSRLCA